MALAVSYQNTPGNNRLICGIKNTQIDMTATILAHKLALKKISLFLTTADEKSNIKSGYRYFKITLNP